MGGRRVPARSDSSTCRPGHRDRHAGAMNTTPAAIALALSSTSTYHTAVGLDRARNRRAARPARTISASRHRFRGNAPAL